MRIVETLVKKRSASNLEGDDFSNAVLDGYIRYLTENYGKKRVDEFILGLGVELDWLADEAAWHSAEFNEKFHRAIFENFPEDEQVVFNVAEYLFLEKNKLSFFTSFVGLFVKPETFFSRMPKIVKRMNRYSDYHFRITNRKRFFATTGVLDQGFRDPKRTAFNEIMHEVALGSVKGCMSLLGYSTLEIKEVSSEVEGGRAVEFTWVNRPFMYIFILGLITFTATLSLIQTFFDYAYIENIVFSACFSMLVSTLVRYSVLQHRMSETVDYQQRVLDSLKKSYAAIQQLNRQTVEHQKQIAEVSNLASVGEVSYMYVHDMASPIMLLTAYSNQLTSAMQKASGDPEKVLKYAKSIEKATQRLHQLQTVFRKTVARDESSESNEVVDIVAICKETVDLFNPLLKMHSIDASVVIVDSSDTELMVESQGGGIESIVLNLVQNAVKILVTHEGERQIELSLRREGANVLLKIEDSGPGMPKERLDQVWKRFGHSKGDEESGLKNNAKGSGFGLYAIKNIVDNMNGDISVESSTQGTCFSIRIPLENVARSAA